MPVRADRRIEGHSDAVPLGLRSEAPEGRHDRPPIGFERQPAADERRQGRPHLLGRRRIEQRIGVGQAELVGDVEDMDDDGAADPLGLEVQVDVAVGRRMCGGRVRPHGQHQGAHTGSGSHGGSECTPHGTDL